MDANILLSKIVANPTDNTWAQAYSTLNLYVVLSIKDEDSTVETIVPRGKELLERIQREYFSQDQKNLENIKKSIEEATSDMGDLTKISIALATIIDNTVYIITVSGARVVLKRSEKIGVVAEGVSGQIDAFSGKIQGDDIMLLETEDFSKKIPVSKLSTLLDHLEVTEISESLAPIIHNEPLGSEAAIIIQYKKFKQDAAAENLQDSASNETLESDEEPIINDSAKKSMFSFIPNISLPANLASYGKKKLIIIAIILLVIVLFASIFFEKGRQEKAKREAILSEILTPANEKLEEANALIALNRGLALDEFTELKQTLVESQKRIKEDTPERKKLDEFIGRVESKIGELGAGSSLTNQKQIFENVTHVTFKDGSIITVSKDGKIYLLSNNGDKEKEMDSKNKNVKAVGANETYVFILGDLGITQTTKSSGSTKTVVEDPPETSALDTFGSNVYGLNTEDNIVDKYSASFSKSKYFTEDIKLSNPTSMSIEGSVFITDGSKIRKFTRGKEDSFTVSGLTKDLGSNAKIFTNPDYSGVYMLDSSSHRIIAISKDGAIQNQYVSKDLSNAASLAVDESGKKIFVVISGKLYSFDL